MLLYVCCSPYQVFNAINYLNNISKNERADLIILGLFPNAKVLANSAQNSGLFCDVYYTEKEDVKQNRLRNITAVKRMLWPKKAIKYFLPSFPYQEKKYTKIISSTYLSDLVVVLQEYFQKKGCILEMIEDGTGPYLYGAHGYSKAQLLFSKVTGKGIPSLKLGNMWFYEKRLLQKKIETPIKELPKMKLLGENVRTINKVFGITQATIKQKYIFLLEGPYEGGVSIETQLILLDKVASLVGKENIVLKPHPKNDINLLRGYEVLPNNIPWELYCVNNEMTEKTIFVVNSTAAYTAKFILDMEPKIVFLSQYYKITSPLTEAFLKMQEGLKDIYNQKDKIIFLKSEDNIKDILITADSLAGRAGSE